MRRKNRKTGGFCIRCGISWDQRTPGCEVCRERHQRRRRDGFLPSLMGKPGPPQRGGKVVYTAVPPREEEVAE